jgi:TBCC domain-containing protein 1
MGGGGSSSQGGGIDRKKYATSASAKELPVWLVATFLLMHCEEMAYQRNLSGSDERRLYGSGGGIVGGVGTAASTSLVSAGGKVDLTGLLKYPGLSPR